PQPGRSELGDERHPSGRNAESGERGPGEVSHGRRAPVGPAEAHVARQVEHAARRIPHGVLPGARRRDHAERVRARADDPEFPTSSKAMPSAGELLAEVRGAILTYAARAVRADAGGSDG